MNIESTIAALTLLGAILGVWMRMETKMKELEIRQSMQEKQDDKIMNKLDDIASDLSEVKIELQNKQNRQ